MSLRKKTSRNRKQKKRIASSSEKWIRRVIHYGDNGVPYLHEAAHYPERVSPNPDWTDVADLNYDNQWSSRRISFRF